VEEIGKLAFRDCSKLKRISTPFSMEKIGREAFKNCRRLVQVQLCRTGLRTIDAMVFYGCCSLESITIPRTVRRIGYNAFATCSSLVDVVLPKRLQFFGSGSFQHCSALSKISIPYTVKRLDYEMFAFCQSLASVELNEGLRDIEYAAFRRCESLSAISIPASVELIANNAFEDCVSLLGVEFIAVDTKIRVESGVFRNCESLVNIALPLSFTETIDSFDGCQMLGFHRSYHGVLQVLRERFANLPVHQACYHATTTDNDDLVIALMSKAAASEMRDHFGMTPFHIVATSAKLRPDILEALMGHYPTSALSRRDSHGKTMMEYLLRNRLPMSTELIKMILDKTLVAKVDMWDVDQWRSNLRSRIDSAEWVSDAPSRQKSLKDIIRCFESYAMIQATSAMEFALWKKTMNSDVTSRKRKLDDRESSRMICGAEVVIPNVIGFLGGGDKNVGEVATSIFDDDATWIRQSIESLGPRISFVRW